MKTRAWRVALAALVAAGVVGCTTMGAGYGTIKGMPTSAVNFDWKSKGEVTGSMTATFADGRSFSGDYFQITRETQIDRLGPLWAGYSPRWHGWNGWYADPGPDFVTHYSGRVLANLTGDDGEHMRCRFQLVRPRSGMKGGGEGSCQLYDGQTIDATFPAA
jgi:hypothetical protein